MQPVPQPAAPAVDGRVVYLDAGDGRRFFTVLHQAETPVDSPIAVLFVPPFGFEELSSYRSVRAWARTLAAAGHPALQVTLPGTGDSSGGPEDPALLAEWVEAVRAAAAWLRDQTGASRVVAVGLGIGGLVACLARGAGAPIDDLLLWGTSAKGRRMVRELQAFSQFSRGKQDDFVYDPVLMPPLAPGALEAGGFVLGAATVEDLRAIDLTRPGALGGAGRALVLGRDGTSPDPALSSALLAAGADVILDDGAGWAAMVDSPHLASIPWPTIDRATRWIASAEPSEQPRTPRVPDAHETLQLTVGDVDLVERAVRLPSPDGRLFAVVTEPVDQLVRRPVTALLLNPGAERHIGANRMWVTLARRWAARGVSVVRLDILGIGDADGPDEIATAGVDGLYGEEYGDQLRYALDGVQALGLPGRYVVAGICSGAYWTFQLALRDVRVRCALTLNAGMLLYHGPRTFEPAPLGRDNWRHELKRRVLAWTRTPQAEPVLRELRRPWAAKLIRRVWGSRTRGDELDQKFDLLRDRGQSVAVLQTPGEALYGELRREGRLDRVDCWPNLKVHLVPGPQDNHTFEVVRVQPHLLALLDEALDAELERLEASSAGDLAPSAGRAAQT